MLNRAHQHAARHAPPMDPFPRRQCARAGTAGWPLWCVLEEGHDGECSPRRKWWKL